MNTDQLVQAIRNMLNQSRYAGRPIEVGSFAFDNAVVVWPIEPPITDWSKPPSVIGGSVYVHDTDTRRTTTWPRLAAPHVIALYRAAKARGEV
ncbi:hypothetical protein [Hamadaea tsunoensis]|uniref:hypothetical protein n=1 Tax=Hamadaea tsunoensis TaxID=53368 RepID=UPI00041625FF|nr:hypothetical protein [Hamadaea tsunoensis]